MKTKKLVCYNCGGHGFITSTYENGQTSAICPVCGGIGTYEIQMTNADRIRAMSDEELVSVVPCPLGFSMFRCPIERQCGPCKREWLKQPAEKEDDHA